MSYILENKGTQDYKTKDFEIKSLEKKELTEKEYQRLISFEGVRNLVKLGYIKISQKTSEIKGSVFGTTGGHIDSGETPEVSIRREVEEELGINVDNDSIKSLGFLLFDMPLRYLFYLKKNIDLNDVKVQKEEVDYVKYMSVDEINKLIESGEMLKSHGIMFKELIKKIK